MLESRGMGTTGSLPRDGTELKGRQREAWVAALFDRISGPYDRLNRVISLGRDRAWRRLAVELAGVGAGDAVCDLGTGTGDLARDLARACGPEGVVVGLDLAPSMLQRAAVKIRESGESVHLVRANAAAVPLPDGWADVVAMGWVLRNVGDRPTAYREVLRLLRPGGRFVCVDMSPPRGPAARLGWKLYCGVLMPILARVMGGEGDAYRYLARSAARFPDALELEEELRRAGFGQVRHRTLALGGLAVHVARVPGGA